MKTLLLMRHAKSSHDDEGLPDAERPLNERGRRDAPRMAARLAAAGLLPDRILCSTALRAKETAALVMEAPGFTGGLKFLGRLYGATPDEILEVVAESGGDAARLMVVGHNPGMEQLLRRLTEFDDPMPTAAIAQIELPIAGWGQARGAVDGRLVEFWKPKDE